MFLTRHLIKPTTHRPPVRIPRYVRGPNLSRPSTLRWFIPVRAFTRCHRHKSQAAAQTAPVSAIEHVCRDDEPIIFSSEQQRVLDMVLAGESIFFTGSAGKIHHKIKANSLYDISGTGKSVLLREIISSLRSRGVRVEVTASTGIAAVNIGGRTLHSFAGKHDS